VVSNQTGKNNEIKILRHLASQSGRTHPGSEHVLALLDHFTVHGVNGEHDVLVFPVVGPHLGDVSERYPGVIQLSIKSLVRQIALGASFLHDCGIVHAG
jgi:serine/threonine-protein kinase SRPK3